MHVLIVDLCVFGLIIFMMYSLLNCVSFFFFLLQKRACFQPYFYFLLQVTIQVVINPFISDGSFCEICVFLAPRQFLEITRAQPFLKCDESS